MSMADFGGWGGRIHVHAVDNIHNVHVYSEVIHELCVH